MTGFGKGALAVCDHLHVEVTEDTHDAKPSWKY